MAASLGMARERAGGASHLLRRALYHLFSFEAVFVLFLYGTRVRILLPPIPMDEELFFGSITIGLGVLILLRRGIYLPGLPIICAGLLFLGWCIMSYAWTPSRVLAKTSLLYLATIDVWALVAGALVIAPDRERVVRLFLLILLLGTAVSVVGLGIYAHYGTFRFYSGFQDAEQRVYLGWSYTVANAAAIAAAIAVFARLGTLKQLAATALFGLFLLFILVAGARGPLLAVGLAFMVALMVKAPQMPRGRIEVPRAWLAGLAVFLLASGYIAYLFATGQVTETLARFIKLLQQAEGETALRTAANRFNYYAAAYQHWLDAPIIGHGVSSFSNLYFGREIRGTHPHNIVLQLLVEYGIVGLVLFLGFCWVALRRVTLRRMREDLLLATLVMLLMTFLLTAMVAADTPKNFRLFFLLALFALAPAARSAVAARATRAMPEEAGPPRRRYA